MTGESEPIEKLAVVNDGKDSVTDYSNIAFMGSNVISSTATAVVIAVGDDTLFGSMASAVAGEAVETSFSKGVNSVSWVLIRFMLVMVPLVFFINGITKGDWLAAFLFGISIAVGLTPGMLPMIVTTCLAKGAVSMSKKKTIVKNLNSIQNFGAIDVLCTDKTGTLTQDKVVLEYHLNIKGDNDMRVLRHAYLNSYFQAGWFVESMWSQTLVIHMIRTPKLPFLQSHASAPLTLLTTAGIALLTIIPFTEFGKMLGFVALPMSYFVYLIPCILLYMLLATSLKKAYVRHYGELL